MGDHGGGDFFRQGGGEGAFPGVGCAGRLHQSEPGGGDGCGPGDVKHGAFGQGEDGVVAREEQLELLHGGLEIVGAVGEAAAADHDEAQVGRIHPGIMLVVFAHLMHGHGSTGQNAVDEGLQGARHAVAIQGIAHQQHVAGLDFFQNAGHVVPVDAGSAVAPAGKAAGAGLNVQIGHMEDFRLQGRGGGHALQKGPGDVHRVAGFPLGAAVKNQYLHEKTSLIEG